MSVIFILILVSLILAIGFLLAFIWAVKNGQFEDDHSPSVRILFEDNPHVSSSKNDSRTSNKQIT